MKRLALILASLALLSADPASAQVRFELVQGPAAQSAPRLSPAQVEAIIQRMTPGRRLNITLERSDGRAIYLVRWQTNDGRRIDYVIDGNSGQVLSRNGG